MRATLIRSSGSNPDFLLGRIRINPVRIRNPAPSWWKSITGPGLRIRSDKKNRLQFFLKNLDPYSAFYLKKSKYSKYSFYLFLSKLKLTYLIAFFVKDVQTESKYFFLYKIRIRNPDINITQVMKVNIRPKLCHKSW